MIRYEAVLETRAGTTQNVLLSETPLKKGDQVYLRGINQTVKIAIESDNQTPHMGDDIVKPPKKIRK